MAEQQLLTQTLGGAPSLLCPFTWAEMPLRFLSARHSICQHVEFEKGEVDSGEKRVAKGRFWIQKVPPRFVRLLQQVTTIDAAMVKMGVPNPFLHSSRMVCPPGVTSDSLLEEWTLKLHDCPESLQLGGIRGGRLPPERLHRKEQQVLNVISLVSSLMSTVEKGKSVVIVDFCCGCGHQSLPLAFFFPDAQFVLIDLKKRSLDIARTRATVAGLHNVRFIQRRIETYDEKFDIGLSLHACGAASDIAMDKCIAARAAFVMAPCCVGKVKTSPISYPRSKRLCEYLHRENFMHIAKAADFGHEGYDNGALRVEGGGKWNQERRMCKSLVEHDRNTYALEQGFVVWRCIMSPASCSPKNDLLIGSPEESVAFCRVIEGMRKICGDGDLY